MSVVGLVDCWELLHVSVLHLDLVFDRFRSGCVQVLKGLRVLPNLQEKFEYPRSCAFSVLANLLADTLAVKAAHMPLLQAGQILSNCTRDV